MLIPILIDPWVTGISLHASNAETLAKVQALNQVCVSLRRHYPLKVLRYIDSETYSQFYEMISTYQGRDRQDLLRFIHHFDLHSDLNNGLPEITETCPPDLPESWLRVLAATGNTDEPPHWRSPMLLVPEIRRSQWPTHDEITYALNGTVGRRNFQRNLVAIESCEEHPYFERDIDPWRLRCVGEPRPDAPVHEMTATLRRLPRPPLIPLNLPLDQLAEASRDIGDWSCGIHAHYFYLPPSSWRPTAREKEDWRRSAFAHDGVVQRERGERESGYLDRNGYIWVWDESEQNHWDVKTASDIRIARVRYDGLELPS